MPSTSSMISLLIAASAATAVAARPMYPEFEERANPSQRRQEDGQDSSETALQRLINSVKQQGVIPGSPINHVALARELAPLPDNFDFEGFFKNLQKGQPVPGILISRQENGEDSSETALQRLINSVKIQGLNVGTGPHRVALARQNVPPFGQESANIAQNLLNHFNALQHETFGEIFKNARRDVPPFGQESANIAQNLLNHFNALQHETIGQVIGARQDNGEDSSASPLQRLINSVKEQGVHVGDGRPQHVALARDLTPLPDNFDFEGFFKNLQKGQPVPGILISRQENGEDSSETALQRFINSVKQQGVNVGDGRIQHVALARALEDRSFLDTFESFLAGLNPFAQQSTASTRDLELVASLARRALNELD